MDKTTRADLKTTKVDHATRIITTTTEVMKKKYK